MLWTSHISVALSWPHMPIECALPELSIKEPMYTKLRTTSQQPTNFIAR
ncbi:unnamed protein product [Callosobruchus maculatus]|uniref:Uncharacterized protein n=1 Tax=Callosobruchus maculatus TaxID=64391 RepID=A0A653D6G8_CALMS|nr:unnamed protein product [Callosobruchus maculatus]VEN58328.1 unnamed protein product [Callosobruchus maculatus]